MDRNAAYLVSMRRIEKGKYCKTNNIVKNNYPMPTDIIIDVNNAWVGKEAVIGITLNSAATGTANIMVGGKTYTVNLTDGKATLKVSDLPAGENTVVVNYDGNDKIIASTNSTTFKVFDGIVTMIHSLITLLMVL